LIGSQEGRLEPRSTADGSPSLWSGDFGEGFHCGRGALAEARAKFVEPAQLERFSPGCTLRVVDVGVGLGYNTAALLEAAQSRGLRLQWWGLELDRRPLAIALADRQFRELWQPRTVELLDQLLVKDRWQAPQAGAGEWWLGDARRMLPQLQDQNRGRCDLVLHDAFSPGRCPQLWTLEFLADLAGLLEPHGRLLTYCTAAAVRRGLLGAGLHLASLSDPNGRAWSLGTAASPTPLPVGEALRALGPMEREHLDTRAAEPYRDPGRNASAGAILAARACAQTGSEAGSTGAWRRRWAVGSGASRLSTDANLRPG
jgi:hypothetical protein